MPSTSHTAASSALATSDQESLAAALDHALKQLDSDAKEIALDFSSVRRVDSSGVRRLEEFAHAAGAKKLTVLLRGVSVDVYKTLKLARLTREFEFVN